MYNNIFKPIKIRDIELKNRIAFAPTTLGYDYEKSLNKLINIAKGGAGLIIIGDVSVRNSFNEKIPTLAKDEHIKVFKKITDQIHKYGCKISAQLFHPDYDVDYIKEIMHSNKISDSEIRNLLKKNMLDYINDISIEKIREIQTDFINAARRAKQAGFDMIQIHGDRLLGSFTSSIFNKRKDEYGGSKENRAKMSVEIVKKIREEFYDMPIDYKFPIRKENPDLGKGGPCLEEIDVFIRLLDKAGADSFHVTIANHSTIKDTIPLYNHPYLKDEGCFLDLAKEVKKYTNKIVCGVGKLKTPDFIDHILKENEVDMVGLSRQLIADEQWPLKVKEKRIDEIQYCKFCNIKCTNALINRNSFGCVLHENS